MKGGIGHLRRATKRLRLNGAAFTIVEVMIVLAVTGVLFVSIAALMSGKQAQAQFNQAINNIKTQLEQIMNEVQAGYFGDPGAAGCFDAGHGVGLERSSCMYIGKLVQFRSGDDHYAVHTLVGQRNATSFATSTPYTPGTADIKNLAFGLEVVSMRVGGTSTNINAVGIITPFGADSAGFSTSTWAPTIAPYYGSLGQDFSAMHFHYMPGSFYQSSSLNPAGGVEICFKSGSTNQSGLITIGAQYATKAIELSIKNSGDCS